MTVNIASPEHKANPHPFYARLRAESPVYQVTLPDKQQAWLVTRYDDVAAVLKDERFAKDRLNALSAEQMQNQPWMPAFFQPLTRNMLDLDEPDHSRLRQLVNKAFTPKIVENLRPRIQSLAEGLLDSFQGERQLDLIRRYALEIPTIVMAELLGIPAADRHKFAAWSKALVAANYSLWAMLRAVPAVWRFLRYIRHHIVRRRTQPGDDLLSALVQAEETGDKLSDDELVAMAFLLLVAGHETTVNLIGSGTLALLQHPDQLDRLRRDPTLIKPAIEELLRFTTPVETGTERYAREELTVAGVTLPKGSLVFAVLASANRDEKQFPDPDRLDITRDPNKHLSFGLGPHYCVGAPLARLEAQIAINTLVQKLPHLQLAIPAEKLRWRRGLVLRGLETLPVTLNGRH